MINILIADDNIYYARALMNTINNQMDEVAKVSHIAIDGQETINILNNNNIDIVLLDLEMPIYNGIDILNYLEKEDKEKYKNSIIVISAESELIAKLKNQEYIYCIINKLTSISSVIKIISELVNQKNEIKKELLIKIQVIKELQYLNYNLSHKGTKYLIDIILLLYDKYNHYDNLNFEEIVYPAISIKYGKSISTIKSNINKSNDFMYKVCKRDKLKEYFKFQDDTKPTVKIVVYTIVNKIIMQYK